MTHPRGKTALITGGAAGIGRTIALGLARDPSYGHVVIVDRDIERARGVADEIAREAKHDRPPDSGRAHSFECDVANGASVQVMVARIHAEIGPVDVLVNNAGIASPPGLPFDNNTDEDWDRTFDVNVKSVFRMCKALAPQFRERRTGSIVNIASTAALIAAPIQPPYSVS